MSALTRVGIPAAGTVTSRDFRPSLARLKSWVEQRDYAGWEPYDFLNSPLLSAKAFSGFPLKWFAIQAGKRIGSVTLRETLRIPFSKNPKALALFISGYCDLARSGEDTEAPAQYLMAELSQLRSPDEKEHCWGYDWPYVSLRGTEMPAFTPNAVATAACGEALLDLWEVFGDKRALAMAESVARFIVTRLNRSVDLPDQLCFSYTPSSFTRIFNSSALCCAYLARLSASTQSDKYLGISCRGMNYLASKQMSDGSWPYGEGRLQEWVDSFHTGFNLSALRAYELASGDHSFANTWEAGLSFYLKSFFRSDGAPKYYCQSTYPIDVHSCSQALLVLGDLAERNPDARELGFKVLRWTEANMQSADGFFYYQHHRWWVNRIPYMRWGQAWMFRALAHWHFAGM